MQKISVIIPTYNCAAFLKDAIDSVLIQTYTDFEIIIVDDGSTDDTKKIINEYKKDVRYFYQKNKGVSSARNRGIKEAEGEYLAFLDSDDIMLPGMLKEHIETINRGYDWVFPRLYYRQILTNGKRGTPEIMTSSLKDIDNIEILYKTLFSKFVGSIRGLVRKSVFNKIGLFNENFSGVEDRDIWLRFCKKGLKAKYVEGPSYIWGSHEKSLTVNSSVKTLVANYKFRKKYQKEAFKIDPGNRRLYSDIFWDIGREAFYLKRYLLFFNCIIASQLSNLSLTKFYNSSISFLKRLPNKNISRIKFPINSTIANPKKNILFVTTAKKLFGSENSLFTFINNLDDEYVPIVIFPEKGELSNLFNSKGIKTLILDLDKFSGFKKIFIVLNIIKEHNISLVHVNYHSDLSKVLIAVKLSKIPIVMHFRMTGEISLSELFKFSLVNRIVCVSEAVKDSILNTRRLKGFLQVKLNNLEVIHNGRDLKLLNNQGNREAFRKEFALNNTKAIGIIGAIAPRKRQDLFVKIAFEILKKNKNVKFFIIGDLYGERHAEYKKQVNDLVKNLDLSEHVIFTSRRDDIANVMKGLDILLVLSKKEAFGGVIIEAMAVGTPVVGIAIEGVKELLGNNEGGILVHSDDKEMISEKIIALLEDELLLQQLSQKAKIWAQRFDIKNQVEKIIKLYATLLNT